MSRLGGARKKTLASHAAWIRRITGLENRMVALHGRRRLELNRRGKRTIRDIQRENELVERVRRKTISETHQQKGFFRPPT